MEVSRRITTHACTVERNSNNQEHVALARSLMPFHGWTWSLEGTLVDLPELGTSPHRTEESHKLPEMSVSIWEGFVFVNFNQDAQPLEEYLGVLPEHWKDWQLGDRYIETHIRKHLPCNWKAGAEAFIEAYHVRKHIRLGI